MSWNEKKFWKQWDAAEKRRIEATIRTGEPIPDMVMEENARYEGPTELKSAIRISDKPRERRKEPPKEDPLVAVRTEITAAIDTALLHSGLKTDDCVNILLHLSERWERKR